jgi:purine/pyrimidine-nucleoside phosphorylase
MMSEFTNVTVRRKANIYFDGKVTSRSVFLPDGSRKTLGIMLPGEYAFTTDMKEIMEILSGELEVLLPDEHEWRQVKGGQSFEVPAHSRFELKVRQITDYCCSFIAA